MVQNAFKMMSLNDNISPLIDIIYKVFFEIIDFGVVLFIVMFAISFCFYLIAHNQIDFDGIPKDQYGSIAYRSMTGSLWYIWFLILGQPDTSAYDLGSGS